MSKYIIEIKPEYEDSFKGLMILGAKDSNLFVDTLAVENLDELNSDYINEHFGRLQDEAYQRGLSEGNDIGYKDGVKDGQNEVWEAVKKIVFNPNDGGLSIQELNKIFGNASIQYVCKNYSASEAIEKLKAYEQKQNDKIEVGDEVIYNGTTKCLVVRPETDERYAVLIDSNGNHHPADHSECKKTGRHFDIASILEDMRE